MVYTNSPSSSSLDVLIASESSTDPTSEGLSARSSAAASSSDLDEVSLHQRSKLSRSIGSERSWCFEGESRPSCSGRMHWKKHLRKKRGQESPSESNVGRCLAGCAADCTAVCCCPLTVFHLLALLCVKLPSTIASRVCRALKKKRKTKKSLSDVADSELWPPSLTPCVSYKEPCVAAMPLPPSGGFGDQHFWGELFDSGHSSFTSPERLRRDP